MKWKMNVSIECVILIYIGGARWQGQWFQIVNSELNIGGLVQERRNSSVLAMELCLSCTNPLI